MELTFECPSCHTVGNVISIETATEVTCRSCSATHDLHPEAFAATELLRCAWCATEDLYTQKDFPQGLGLVIVVAGFVASTVFWYYEMPLSAYAVLLISALVDMVLYYHVGDVTICYRCLGQHRGAGSNRGSRFAPFDLAVGERYRQERLRIDQLRQRQGSAGSSRTTH